MSGMWIVYILETKCGRYYTGSTNNLKRRLAQHKAGRGARFTRAFGFKRLLHKESYSDQSTACRREAEIKSWNRQKKSQLLNGQTP